MPDITIYTTPLCPYCNMAKGLLKRKGVDYAEIDVSMDAEIRAAMRQRAGGRNSVPQIFVGTMHVGGCDDIHALEQQGKLDALLVAQ
jgi:glutaredoxin 3